MLGKRQLAYSRLGLLAVVYLVEALFKTDFWGGDLPCRINKRGYLHSALAY